MKYHVLCYLSELEGLHPWLSPRLCAEVNCASGTLQTFSWSSLQHSDNKGMSIGLSREGSQLNPQYVPNCSILLSHLWFELLNHTAERAAVKQDIPAPHAHCVSRTPTSIMY